ncbi:hypothetical protein DAPPUDRAFT_226103 [Daphnia pulex]|uniref:Peptidase metallopeptidase domain-containing protein n=1 Tax=Daphnia pulex TaxID=6669 RepID=E9GW38_DAPPU|nr:hypothetical protein DAPPUDRAFT_226103 [Daphnia pulex]|eukprot:EFX76334.1 hypothetical protein DAPPUDRAFT_226103 [Daphnia pulex]
MKRPSSFNGLLVMASLIMAQMGVSVESHPLQRRLDHWASPMTESEDHARPSRSTRDINDNLLMFLMTFGYLPQSDLETGNLRTEHQVRDAIKTLQAFAHIPVTGIVDEATRELMKKPRCGLPDINSDSYRAKRSLSSHEESEPRHRLRHQASRTTRNKRYTVQGQRWHYTNLTWSLRKGAKSRDMDSGQIRYQVHRALNLWQEASRLTFTEVNHEDADIRVSFHSGFHNDGYPFDGKGTLLAHAFFPGTGIGGDAHFDDEEPWVADEATQNSELSFFAVAAHEFGHSLGLSHSSVQGAIMFPYYQSVDGSFSLHSDDITGIQAIYGSRNEGRVTNPALRPSTTTTPSPRITGKPEIPTKPTQPTKKPVHPPKPHPRPPHGGRKPSTCDTTYDAISIIRRELFIFKDRYFWRIGPTGLEANYPVEIERFWSKLPVNLTHIDAIYEKPSGQREMVIFIGKQYWIYPNNEQGLGPYPLTNLGLPTDLEKLDGALVWGHNGKTYFFSGSMYWRFDEETGKVELDYPRDMSMWKGVPYNIDAVFQHTNGKTYFFKGKVFWEFNDRRMRVVNPIPSLSAPYWLSCPTGMHTLEEDMNAGPGEGRYQVVDIIASSKSISASPAAGLQWCLISCLLLWWFIHDSW